MSKYNLSELLTEVAGGRIGTLNISARDLVNKMEDLEDKGVKVDRYDGLSPDGKTYLEFHVHPMRKYDEDSSFSVYDFKFGFDPMSEEHFMEEYPFSIGGRSAALDSAETVLRSGNVGYEVSESISEEKMSSEEEIENIKRMNPKADKKSLKKIAKMGNKKIDELSMGKKDEDDDGKPKFKSAQYGIGDAFIDAIKKRVQKEMTLPNPIMRHGFEGDNYQEKETERMRRDGSSGESQKSMASVPFYQRDVKYDDNFFMDDLNDGELEESFGSLAKKIDKQKGKSKKDAANIAGYIANIKRKGGGSGPTAKQKKRMAKEEIVNEDDKKDLLNAMRYHLLTFEKGIIDKDDVINAMQELAFGRVKAPGMNEEDINEAPGSTINLSQDDMDKLHSDGKLDIDGHKVIYKMNENGHVDDYADEIKEDDIVEMSDDEKRYTDTAAKMLKDRVLKDIPMDIIVDFVKTHGSDIRRMNNSEIKSEFEEFRSVNYDYIDENLKGHFNRFK